MADSVLVNDSLGVTLTGDLTINHNLQLLKGIITTGSNMVDVRDTLPSSVNAGNDTSFIFGRLHRAVADTGYFMFPIGDSSHYQFAAIHLDSNTHAINGGFDSLTAIFTIDNSLCTTLPGSSTPYVNGSPLDSLLNGGYWTIHPETTEYTGISYSVSLKERNFTNPPASANEMAVVKRSTCSDYWQSLGTHINSTQSLTTGLRPTATAVRSLLSSFSDFGIGFGSDGALPVELVYLQANPVDNSYIQVKWETVLEINNYGFNVERSTDGSTWNKIGFVSGHGNSTSVNDYSLNDMDVVPNVHFYYRLKQIDNNGNFKYTDVVTAMITGGGNSSLTNVEFYPNPSSGMISLVISSTLDQEITVQIYDIMGQKVLLNNYQVLKGDITPRQLNLQLLASGTYSVVVSSATDVYTKKLVITK